MAKLLKIQYVPKDMVDGCNELTVEEELAYRRICDFIYLSEDALVDDDKRLGWMTKLGRRWPKIKAELIARGKIDIEEGLIRNDRCTKEFTAAERFWSKKSDAGHASARKRKEKVKSLKNNKTGSTGVGNTATNGATNQPYSRIAETSSKTSSSQQSRARDDGFAEWWDSYPNKVGKKAAAAKYGRIVEAGEATPEQLITGLRRYIRAKPGDRPWCNPLTWLNQGRWDDQPAEPATDGNGQDARHWSKRPVGL